MESAVEEQSALIAALVEENASLRRAAAAREQDFLTARASLHNCLPARLRDRCYSMSAEESRHRLNVLADPDDNAATVLCWIALHLGLDIRAGTFNYTRLRDHAAVGSALRMVQALLEERDA